MNDIKDKVFAAGLVAGGGILGGGLGAFGHYSLFHNDLCPRGFWGDGWADLSVGGGALLGAMAVIIAANVFQPKPQPRVAARAWWI